MGTHRTISLALAFFCALSAFLYGNPAHAVVVTSTFDEDAEGWSVIGGADGPVFTLARLPLGYICATDTDRDGANDPWYFRAPDLYLGDNSDAYGNALTFRLRTSRYRPDQEALDVVIKSGPDSISFPFLVQPGFDWTPYRVPLDENAGWVFSGTETQPSAAQMRSMLSAVTDILIRPDFGTHNNYASEAFWSDTGCLDDVVLELGPADKISGDITGNIKGWAAINGAMLEETDDTSVCAYDEGRDGSVDPWYWKAPNDYLGNILDAYGKALTFRLKTTRYRPDEEMLDVLIHGNGETLAYRFFVQPGPNWTPYRVPLDAGADWVYLGTEQLPTEDEMRDILTSVTDILIRPDFGTNNNYADSGWWDDIGCLTNTLIEIDPVRPKLDSVISTFDTDNEGWGHTHESDDLQYEVSGIPLGYVCANDTSRDSTWFWKAPGQFLGDVSAAYGGMLEFDLKTTSSGDEGTVYLHGNGITLYTTFSGLNASFTNHVIFLDTRGGWVIEGSPFGDLASEAHIQQALLSLTDIMIQGDYNDSGDTGCLDNVGLRVNGEALTIQRAYLAYYGRPADVPGGDYWSEELALEGGNLDEVIEAFGNSDEFTDRYGNLTNSQLIDNIYRQLLGRTPDIAGKNWYLAQLAAGNMSLQTITLNVLNGATQGDDKATVDNKLEAALYYTSRLRETERGYNSEVGAALDNVTSDYATVLAVKQALESLL